MAENQVEQWAVIDLFGHTRLAGRISDHALGGESFIRVDVPAVGDTPEHTRLFGKGAIYSISFVSKEVAEGVARNCQTKPITMYDFDEPTRRRISAVPATTTGDFIDEDDDEDRYHNDDDDR